MLCKRKGVHTRKSVAAVLLSGDQLNTQRRGNELEAGKHVAKFKEIREV